ncbi:uncharacterized protein DUF3558 [Herbihabitans rhizosphaerae]|uniref:Uncharacterized protein DUF3558 n=1 Tax=Herbihabitans rhizosphaerae TaxID=1872711 RepID=A0A4Q7KDE8_9PSEU|nr:DUF3558 domain-containing protein [Herbihabitans rhizosphaerae]RZS29609.1 uncharacterized protein DUF3558 [Herbihabitans rhizosphaerae]
MRRRLVGLFLAFLALCLAMAGCTSTVSGTASAAGSDGGGQGNEPDGPPPRTPQPPDRDAAAVTSALRKLDACALIDIPVAKSLAPNATPIPRGPHSCLLSPTPQHDIIKESVRITVGDDSDHVRRFSGVPVTIGGAKAYEYRDDSSSRRCEIAVPVSFTLAITVEFRGDDVEGACRVVRKVTEAAIGKLRNPDALNVDPAKRPFAAWDGCTFLKQVLGNPPEFDYVGEGTYDPFSGCAAAKRPQRGQPPSATSKEDVKLTAEYDEAPKPAPGMRPIGGKQVVFSERTGECKLEWAQGDSGTGDKDFGVLMFELSANCQAATQIAEKIMQLAGQAPSDATSPQRPLLYGPNEPDTAAVGACIHSAQGSSKDCEPYQPTEVPKGYQAIIAAVTKNRHVQCAVFEPAIKAAFGPEFLPLSWGQHCFFVEPTHALHITVNVLPPTAMHVPGKYGRGYPKQEVQLGGKPASTYSSGKDSFDIYLSAVGDLNAGGGLHIGLEARPPRGDQRTLQAQLDPAKIELAKQAMTQVVQTRL